MGEQLRRLEALLHAIGKLRDGLLVSVALLYAIGYCSYAIGGADPRLRPAALLDAQYLAAGVLPSLGLLGVCALGSYSLRRARRDVAVPNPRRTALLTIPALLLVAVLVTVTRINAIAMARNPMLDAVIDMPYSSFLYVGLLVAAIVYFVLVVLPNMQFPTHRAGWSSAFYVLAYMLPLALMLLAMSVIGTRHMPVALGGTGWRAARLDLIRNELSESTTRLLVGDPRHEDGLRVVRSVPVMVIDSGRGTVAVRVGREDIRERWTLRQFMLERKAGQRSRPPIVELRHDAVAAILWE